MTFPKYERYKDSGVEWLGEIPEHWEVKKLKFLADIRNGLDYKSVQSDSEQYPVIGSGGQFAYSTQPLYSGESVLLGRKGTINKPLYVNGSFWTVDTMFYTEIKRNTFPKFLYYSSLTIPFDYYSTNTAVPSMTQNDLGNHIFAYPPIAEQERIAEFLDRKCGEIDEAIAKKQRLIELLDEQKTILINQAVTKGLNPDAPMKDSAIDWLGQIPAHWEVCPLKRSFHSITVGIVITPSKYYVDFGVPCLRSLNVKANCLLEKDLVYISDKSNNFLSKSQIFKDDIVCVRTGQPGTTAVVTEKWHKANCIDLIIIRKSKKVLSHYLSVMMNSEVCRSQYLIGSSGAIQQHFNIEMAKNLIICYPPIDEQEKILRYSFMVEQKANTAKRKIGQQLEQLTELKQVLIAEAVTGKIKV